MSQSAIMSPAPAGLDGRGGENMVAQLDTIDFARLVANDPGEASKLHHCCETHGFFYLDLRGTESSRQVLSDEKDVLHAIEAYFDQPLDVKMRDHRADVTQSGYKPVGLLVGADAKAKDGYERFKVVCSDLAGEPNDALGFIHQNFGLLDRLASQSRYITKSILAHLASGLGPREALRVEQSHHDGQPNSSNILLLHYPKNLDENNFGNTNHTDVGSLTLLFSNQWGLQVMTPEYKTWVYVQPKANHAIVNIGDSLRFLSGKRFYSCLHRVIPANGVRQDEDRYTVAYFLRPENNTEFEVDGKKMSAVQWRDAKNELYATPGDPEKMGNVLSGGMEQILKN